MKREYNAPQLFAETFVANEYCGACKEPVYSITETVTVTCESSGHNNTQTIAMFTDELAACIAKFVPNVGQGDGDKFHTQFEACAYDNGCNKQRWLANHPTDTNFARHAYDHASINFFGISTNDGAFINHDTTINMAFAEKYHLS